MDDKKETRGRKTKFKPEYVNIIKGMCKLGATVPEIAEALEVAVSTVNLWRVKHDELRDAMQLGRDASDQRVVDSLYHRALGYSHAEDDIRVIDHEIVITPTVKHYPPDATSMIFWLKNRRPDEWRQHPDFGGDDDAPELTINFAVSEPVKDIKVTRGESKGQADK